ncbi:MAG: TlpA disulfide reductase family protein [Candidatus Desulfatibia sp.]|uniref:TlpA family protein disulfide reductase n=1 Tax=Candidatus Desulfatibia sp. TaxID=3101189 RepID=UPI002F334D6B
MPSLVKLYDEFQDSGFVVLGVNVREKSKIVEKYVKKEKIPFPILLDKDGSVARDYGIRSHPAHFIIDRQGQMIGKVMGARNWASVESRDLIRSLIAQE